jgi:hypothetical protein
MRSTCSGVMMPALLLDPRHSKAERLVLARRVCMQSLPELFSECHHPWWGELALASV